MCQWLKKKCAILATDIDNGGDYSIVGGKRYMGISVPSPQFCCKHKTAIKKKKSLKISLKGNISKTLRL